MDAKEDTVMTLMTALMEAVMKAAQQEARAEVKRLLEGPEATIADLYAKWQDAQSKVEWHETCDRRYCPRCSEPQEYTQCWRCGHQFRL